MSPIAIAPDEEAPGPVPWRPARAVPLGVLGMIALILLVESSIMRHDFDLTTLVAANWRLEANAPARHARTAKILCFGDSMVKFGVQPRVLGASLGRPVYNFALYCGTAMTSYYQLRRAFDAGARPEAIVVDFQPELIACDAFNITSRTTPEILTAPELVELCWTAGNFNRMAEYLICRTLPSARKRHEVRAEVKALLGGTTASIREKVAGVRRNWTINSGAEVLPKFLPYNGELPDLPIFAGMFKVPWKGNKISMTYLERFLNLAREKKVPVFWVLQPNAHLVDLKREAVGYNAQYEYTVRGYQKHYPNLFVVDGRHINYPGNYFTDPVHLDRNGATAYSLGLADAMRPLFHRGTVPRWQAVPDRRERANEVALEDNLQSILFLRAAADAAKLAQAASTGSDAVRR